MIQKGDVRNQREKRRIVCGFIEVQFVYINRIRYAYRMLDLDIFTFTLLRGIMSKDPYTGEGEGDSYAEVY